MTEEIKYSDECYTPPLVYAAVRDWACREYNIEPDTIIRPFYPGGDYQKCNYPAGCTVLDNPPFSILSKICAFYLAHNIRFFLFAPTLTLFGQRSNLSDLTAIVAGNNITYENGIKIPTSYVTNCADDDIAVRADVALTQCVERALEETYGESKRRFNQYDYPDNLYTAAMLRKYCNHGIAITIRRDECLPIAQLDNQGAIGQGVFGGGLLVSDGAAAKRVAAEHKVVESTQPIKVELSEREKELISALSR